MKHLVPIPSDTGEFLLQARKRLALALEDDAEQRSASLEDLNFANGSQWDEDHRRERDQNGLPTLTINLIPERADSVIGEQRQNRPAFHVTPASKDATRETAEALEGLIRQIDDQSDGARIRDKAFEQALLGDRGFWSVKKEWLDDQSFEQVLRLSLVEDCFSVVWDPREGWEDKTWVMVTHKLSKEAFRARYPHASLDSLEDMRLDAEGYGGQWINDEGVRVASYWIERPAQKRTLYQVDGQATWDKPSDPRLITNQRVVQFSQIENYVISGSEILEKKTVWEGSTIPIVGVWGKALNIQGKTHRRGIVRFMKDAQRMFNYFESSATMAVMMMPRAPFVGSPRMFEGFEEEWASAAQENIPILMHNHDPSFPGQRPQRESPPTVSTGDERRSEMNRINIRSTSGVPDASIGASGNETSGRAILARQREGDSGTFAFIDNLRRAILDTGNILLEMIPIVYDTPRIETILGRDGSIEQVQLNSQEPGAIEGGIRGVQSFSAGRYLVKVETGPSFSTQRREATQAMLELAQGNPGLFSIMGDLLVEGMDWPNADQIAKRLRASLPSHLQATLSPEKQQELLGALQAVAPQGPSPQEEALAKLDIREREERIKTMRVERARMQSEMTRATLEAGRQIEESEESEARQLAARLASSNSQPQPSTKE